MKLFKLFSILVWLYATVQSIVWIGRGQLATGIPLLCCAPILFIIYVVVTKIQKKQDEKIEAEMAEKNEPVKPTLFKD